MKIQQARQLFRLTSHLLLYPDAHWHQGLEEVERGIRELEGVAEADPLCRFLWEVRQMEEGKWCTDYVNTFDFGRSTCLYVTYARCGEQRERGAELLKMKQQYRLAGWEPTEEELSDYLPLMLEFASIAPVKHLSALFGPHLKAIQSIQEELVTKGSPYTHLLEAVLGGLAGVGVLPDKKGEDFK